MNKMREHIGSWIGLVAILLLTLAFALFLRQQAQPASVSLQSPLPTPTAPRATPSPPRATPTPPRATPMPPGPPGQWRAEDIRVVGERKLVEARTFGVPIWSPNGNKLLFEKNFIHSYATGRNIPDDGVAEIWCLDVSNGSATMLAQEARWPSWAPGGHREHFGYPTWSPDGNVIAFVRTPTGSGMASRSEIWVVNKDGSGLRNLTENDLEENVISWSPQGDVIIFMRCKPGCPMEREDAIEMWMINLKRNSSGLTALRPLLAVQEGPIISLITITPSPITLANPLA